MHNRLKEIRKKLGLKQREVAEKLGINVGTVGQWEAGIAMPGAARIYQICDLFNVNREWLETGAGEMFVKEESLDDAARMRRMVGDLFEMLPEDKQKIIYDAVQNWIKKYGDKSDC